MSTNATRALVDVARRAVAVLAVQEQYTALAVELLDAVAAAARDVEVGQPVTRKLGRPAKARPSMMAPPASTSGIVDTPA